MTLLPSVLWAQRKDHLIITIDLQDAKQPAIKLDNHEGTGTVTYRGQARSHATGAEFHDYELKLELYSEIDSGESKVNVGDRRVLLEVAKPGSDTEYWPRLLKSKAKVPNVKVDWSKWVDEDEEAAPGAADKFDMGDLQNLSNFDMSSMGGAAAAAAAGGGGGLNLEDAGDDSDDEPLPDLQTVSK